MRYRQLSIALLIAFLTCSSLIAENWPHWRGPSHNGVSAEIDLPVSWGAKCAANSPAAEAEATNPGAQTGGFGQRGGFGGGRGPRIAVQRRSFGAT